MEVKTAAGLPARVPENHSAPVPSMKSTDYLAERLAIGSVITRYTSADFLDTQLAVVDGCARHDNAPDQADTDYNQQDRQRQVMHAKYLVVELCDQPFLIR